MTIKIVEVNLDGIINDLTGIVILPVNYLTKEPYNYHSSSLSFHKFAKNKLEINFLNEPKMLLEQKSNDWFGPVLFISSFAYTQNPEIISILCGIVANYVTEFFKGTKQTEVKLRVIVKETKTSIYKEIQYEGPVSGLSELNANLTNMFKEK